MTLPLGSRCKLICTAADSFIPLSCNSEPFLPFSFSVHSSLHSHSQSRPFIIIVTARSHSHQTHCSILMALALSFAFRCTRGALSPRTPSLHTPCVLTSFSLATLSLQSYFVQLAPLAISVRFVALSLQIVCDFSSASFFIANSAMGTFHRLCFRRRVAMFPRRRHFYYTAGAVK